MRKRNLKYYIKTVILKARAFRAKLMMNTKGVIKRKAAERKTHLDALQTFSLPSQGDQQPDLFYHTYSYFKRPEDLAASLLINDQGIAYSSLNSPYSDYINPLFPSYYGLVCYNHFHLTGDETSKSKFLKQVDFLSDFGNWKGESFELNYPFDLPTFELRSPWKAGITQALAASAFHRAHLLAPDKEYDKFALGCLKTMFIPQEQGGVYCQTPEGGPWIEEYPSKPPSLVLNGFIFCIVAVLEHAQYHQDEYYLGQAEELIKSLIQRLHHYKYGKYIRHNMKQWQFSNLEYQGLNVFQFVHLYRLTKLELFKRVALEINTVLNWEDFFYFYQMPAHTIDLEEYLSIPTA